MELVGKGTFKYLGLKQFNSKKGKALYVAQFHDGQDVYEFFLEHEQVSSLPGQFEDVELVFELTKYRNNTSLRLNSINKVKRMAAVGGS